MSATKKPTAINAKPPKREALDDVPQFFRLNVEVGDLDAATSFYTKLLGVQGRKQPGHRCYFDCGPVTLQVLDVSSESRPHPAAKSLYFTVKNLEAVFDRAQALGCCRARKFTMHREAASWCARGANDRSMPRIHGEILFVW
jgi:predicted enzyme related to lactoylglutathione lyase